MDDSWTLGVRPIVHERLLLAIAPASRQAAHGSIPVIESKRGRTTTSGPSVECPLPIRRLLEADIKTLLIQSTLVDCLLSGRRPGAVDSTQGGQTDPLGAVLAMHDEITKEGLGKEGVRERAQDMFPSKYPTKSGGLK